MKEVKKKLIKLEIKKNEKDNRKKKNKLSFFVETEMLKTFGMKGAQRK